MSREVIEKQGDIVDLIANPPAGISPEQAQWIHQVVLATFDALKRENGLGNLVKRDGERATDESDEWNFDLRKFDADD
jgi:hypothetical protein